MVHLGQALRELESLPRTILQLEEGSKNLRTGHLPTISTMWQNLMIIRQALGTSCVEATWYHLTASALMVGIENLSLALSASSYNATRVADPMVILLEGSDTSLIDTRIAYP